jgi:hypothetical protein
MHEKLLPRCREPWLTSFVHDVVNLLFPRCREPQQVIARALCALYSLWLTRFARSMARPFLLYAICHRATAVSGLSPVRHQATAVSESFSRLPPDDNALITPRRFRFNVCEPRLGKHHRRASQRFLESSIRRSVNPLSRYSCLAITFCANTPMRITLACCSRA